MEKREGAQPTSPETGTRVREEGWSVPGWEDRRQGNVTGIVRRERRGWKSALEVVTSRTV